MNQWILTDTDQNIWIESFELDASKVSGKLPGGWTQSIESIKLALPTDFMFSTPQSNAWPITR